MRRQNRASWISLVRQVERSGLSQRAFAEERGVPIATLRSWIYRVRREERNDVPRLLPVRVVPSTAPTARWTDEADAIEVTLPDGVRLRFGGRTPPESIAELIARLRPSR